jgi:hypothetical protein
MFAPMIILFRNYLGQPKFNQLRGKLIALHAQTITWFCDREACPEGTLASVLTAPPVRI